LDSRKECGFLALRNGYFEEVFHLS
jgi:hypothetical protein